MNLPLHWRMLMALAAAVLAGSLLGDSSLLLKTCELIGTLFLNGLKMLIVPLILAALITLARRRAEKGRYRLTRGDLDTLPALTAPTT